MAGDPHRADLLSAPYPGIVVAATIHIAPRPASTPHRRARHIMRKTTPRAPLRVAAVLAPALPLAGCASRGAPSYVLFGAYFPLWLVSAIVGVIGAIVAHRVFVATGWAATVPYQLAVCTAIGLVVAVIVWLTGTGPFA